MSTSPYQVRPIGHVRSPLTELADAPRQGNEGAPRATLELERPVHAGLDGIAVGDEVLVLTWFHRARRDVLKLHPRDDPRLPISGVFATRSPDRPNPIGLHRVRVVGLSPGQLEVEPLEAIDGTPIVDIKPVLDGRQ